MTNFEPIFAGVQLRILSDAEKLLKSGATPPPDRPAGLGEMGRKFWDIYALVARQRGILETPGFRDGLEHLAKVHDSENPEEIPEPHPNQALVFYSLMKSYGVFRLPMLESVDRIREQFN